MKTYDNLYDEIIALPNLYHAYYEAKKGKVLGRRFLTFNKNLHENLWQLHEELLSQSYEFSPYTVFHVSDYKTRRIMAPHFRDHTVHHAIYNYLEPIYESAFIYDSFACRKGKGTHKAFFRSRKFLNKYSSDDYFMKCDVTKYFYSIDHYKLMELLERKIKDERLLWLLGRVIDSHNEETMPHHIANPEQEEQRKGIPIGNLTSQLFANIYLNELDQFIKHRLKVRHYVRYVDDFIILARDKNYLHKIWQKIRNFLANELYLTLEPRKTHINKISFGVDFAGYVAFKRYTRVRTRNYRRFMNNLRGRIFLYKTGRLPAEKLYASFVSYQGHLGHTDSERLKENLFALYKNTFHGSVVEGSLPISKQLL